MKCSVFLCLLAVGLANAKNIDLKDRNINDLFPAALERLRENMPTGVMGGDLILAPLEIEEITTDFTVDILFHLEGPLKNFVMSNLDHFQVSQMYYDYETSRLSYDVTLPDTRADGWYDLRGYLGTVIPIFGTGDFHFAPSQWRFQGYIDIGTGEFDKLFVENFYMRLSVRNVDSFFENLLLGGELGDLINVVVSDFAVTLLDKFHVSVSATLEENVGPIFNSILSMFTFEELLDFLEG